MVTSDHVLKELNRFRAEHWDLEPLEEMPKGKPRICGECPVARSLPLGWDVGSSHALGPLDDEMHPLPEAVVRFVNEFDHGDYPELIER